MSATNPSSPSIAPPDVFHRRESEVRSYCRSYNVTFTSATGSTVRDETGRRYIDFLAGCSALNYGHNDPDMRTALIDHLTADTMSHTLDMNTVVKREFLEALESIVLEPRGLDYRAQFTGPTGTNAVEAALKLARKVTGRTNVIAFTNGFHGVTLGALAATGNQGNRMGPSVPLPGVTRALYDGYLGPDVDTAAVLEQLLNDPSSGVGPPAAILVETVQGEGGLNTASERWMVEVARIAKANGALLIVDDIQAGCGRTGTFFSFEGMGFQPDIVTLSKSLSGYGLPMALVLIRPELDIWNPAEHNGTFRGNAMAFVTARVALEKYWTDDGLVEQTAKSAERLSGSLTEIVTALPGARLKGRSMFQGVDVGSGELAEAICRRSFEHGLIIETAGAHGEVVKVLAPLTTPSQQLAEGLDILQTAVDEVSGARVSVGVGR